MEFSVSSLLQNAKESALGQLENLENLAEQTVPSTKSMVEKPQDVDFEDLFDNEFEDFESGKYSAANQSTGGKIRWFSTESMPAEAVISAPKSYESTATLLDDGLTLRKSQIV